MRVTMTFETSFEVEVPVTHQTMSRVEQVNYAMFVGRDTAAALNAELEDNVHGRFESKVVGVKLGG